MTTQHTPYTAESLKGCRLADIAHLMNNLETHHADLLAALRGLVACTKHLDAHQLHGMTVQLAIARELLARDVHDYQARGYRHEETAREIDRALEE